MQIQMIPIGGEGFGDSVKMFVLLTNVVRDECSEGERYMAWYPPKISSQRYVRTGKLRNSWSNRVKTGGNRIEGEVGSNSNIAPYNEQVQGANQEQFFEQRGWRNVEDLQRVIEKSLPERAQDAINSAF